MNKKIFGYTCRFILLHVITYVLCGIVFMELQNYEEAFASMEAFKLFRDLNDPFLTNALIPIQILRGGIQALLIYPFYNQFMQKRNGWLLLFGIIYGFTFVVAIVPGYFYDVYQTITTGSSISELFVGPLEVTVQMFAFSWLFFKWERKKLISHQKKPATT